MSLSLCIMEQAERAAMASRAEASIRDLRIKGELHCWVVRLDGERPIMRRML